MALSLELLKKPVGDLLMHSGETYRRIQEERELIDRALPTLHDRKVRTVFSSALGDEGLETGGTKNICPLQSILKPSRPLLNSILGPTTGCSGTGQLGNLACRGHW